MSKESFKGFVKKNPNLITFVNSDKMTWQKFYDMYELYGEESNIWDKYREVGDTKSISKKSGLFEDTSIKDIFEAVKKIDLESVRKGVDGIQKAILLIQDLGIGANKTTPNTYQKRPMYKYFED